MVVSPARNCAVRHHDDGPIGWLWLLTKSVWLVAIAYCASNNWGQYAFKYMKDAVGPNLQEQVARDLQVLNAGFLALLVLGILLLWRGDPRRRDHKKCWIFNEIGKRCVVLHVQNIYVTRVTHASAMLRAEVVLCQNADVDRRSPNRPPTPPCPHCGTDEFVVAVISARRALRLFAVSLVEIAS